jgi:hypothetical protein
MTTKFDHLTRRITQAEADEIIQETEWSDHIETDEGATETGYLYGLDNGNCVEVDYEGHVFYYAQTDLPEVTEDQIHAFLCPNNEFPL